jgi:hypothetical protein
MIAVVTDRCCDETNPSSKSVSAWLIRPQGREEGNLWFFGYAEVEYDYDGGTSARRQRIVDELVAKVIRRPQLPL